LNQHEPRDLFKAVGVIIFMLGLGMLLPWNFFITASQYFNQRLMVTNSSSNSSAGASSHYNYDSWMVLLSQLPLLLFTLLNSLLYHRVRERLRVTFSLVGILLLFSLTAALVQVPLHPDTFFSVTMATIWFISTCSAVLQSSLFGLVGLFPPRYSTLFMSGQGLAGIFAAVAMLLSIVSDADASTAAMGYFLTPCAATLGTLLCYLLLPHLKFASFYLSRRQRDSAQSQELLGSDGEATPVSKSAEAAAVRRPSGQERLSVPAVFRKIWPMALCVTCVFAITLSVFPVITVRVRTVYKDDLAWDQVFTCVCCFIVFNAMDLVGRSSVSVLQWPSRGSALLPVAVHARLLFIPLLMLCNVENSRLGVVFAHDGAFVAIMAAFSFSNGYLATLCMAYAPQMVRGKDSETAGSLMTFFLILGLAVGAAFSFLLGSLV
uniref:Solute carrier family 29 member 2 n=1 Tax=Tetraodon nigroviridis TaxID=99883 RepID=H3CAL8_TETNG